VFDNVAVLGVNQGLCARRPDGLEGRPHLGVVQTADSPERDRFGAAVGHEELERSDAGIRRGGDLGQV
jgi:hypothetical protein